MSDGHKGKKPSSSKTTLRVVDSSPASKSRKGINPGLAAYNARKAEERKAREALRDMPSRWQQFLAGDIKLEDLDNEELARGRCRDADGNFGGPSPRISGKMLADMKRELLRRGQILMDTAYNDAIQVLAEMAKSDQVKDADRYKAATFLVERVGGKMPDTVVLKSADPWQDILDEIVDEAVEELHVDTETGS